MNSEVMTTRIRGRCFSFFYALFVAYVDFVLIVLVLDLKSNVDLPQLSFDS